jgi:pimeloyl-ACP methyl ester carboxylesterase
MRSIAARLLIVAGAALGLTGAATLPPAASASSYDTVRPTIVLVHGAFADASGWGGVTERLQKAGYTVLAPANPLRGLATDAAYLRSILATINGPIVLVGPSYGGAVITNAATGNPNVKALVYVAAFALQAGESANDALTLGGGTTALAEHLLLRPEVGAGGANVDGYLDPAFFHELFCADVPDPLAASMATAQRPAVLSSLLEPSGPPAWASIPSWFLVAGQDHAIPPAAERAMAARAGAHTIEVSSSSHVAMISHPKEVAGLIESAAGD